MKIKAVVCAIVALSMAVGGSVFAQASTYETQRDADLKERAQHQRPQDRRDDRARQPNQYQGQDRERNDQRRDRRGNDQRWDERGAGPDHQFRRGDRLPPQYRHRNYVVDDWHGHGLSAPPRGYHWVQSGSDYLLVAIATGIILQLILNN
ncbi:MAG: RcnB family protein [Rhodoferax sp.]|uniref:RcnB family protein n=1 Tax=Rhodoferax sp. TaxID=50421 RepID=UPI0026058254|nr:RcnB family protein [Rhodoferax sp.]MDD5332782.1 RcnB family protein [Rhodoferax sp.]